MYYGSRDAARTDRAVISAVYGLSKTRSERIFLFQSILLFERFRLHVHKIGVILSKEEGSTPSAEQSTIISVLLNPDVLYQLLSYGLSDDQVSREKITLKSLRIVANL